MYRRHRRIKRSQSYIIYYYFYNDFPSFGEPFFSSLYKRYINFIKSMSIV